MGWGRHFRKLWVSIDFWWQRPRSGHRDVCHLWWDGAMREFSYVLWWFKPYFVHYLFWKPNWWRIPSWNYTGRQRGILVKSFIQCQNLGRRILFRCCYGVLLSRICSVRRSWGLRRDKDWEKEDNSQYISFWLHPRWRNDSRFLSTSLDSTRA